MALRNLITDIPVCGWAMPATPSSARARRRSYSTPPWWRAWTCGGPGTRETALLRSGADGWRVSTPSCSRVVRPSGSMRRRAWAKPGCASRAAASASRDAVVPIVPAAIMFDLLNGGDKNWGRYPPYRELGYEAAKTAGAEFGLGSVGAGLGATTATLKGGVGSASAMTRDGITIGALAVVNAVGSTVIGDGPHFWTAPFEQNREFSGRGSPAHVTPADLALRAKGGAGENATIAATAARLSKAQCNRLAVMARARLHPRDLSGAHAA